MASSGEPSPVNRLRPAARGKLFGGMPEAGPPGFPARLLEFADE
ncbi:MAG: hypothetical protein QOJ07_2587, partial [Thermoleophilaceae bacterium]|nr:hypothetical protein [Thermoleophilaceae bacterium]